MADMIKLSSFTGEKNNLEIIGLNNPKWANDVFKFTSKFPEFEKYVELIYYSNNFLRIQNDFITKSLFEEIIWYICTLGSSYEDAMKDYGLFCIFLRNGNWDVNCRDLYSFLSNSTFSVDKKYKFWKLFSYMKVSNITKFSITIHDALNFRCDRTKCDNDNHQYVKYIKHVTNSICTKIVYHGNFIKGFRNVYGYDDRKFIKLKCNKIDALNFGSIANLFFHEIGRLLGDKI
jgi:hypothetical protein